LVLLICSCASLIESDYIEPVIKVKSFSVKDGIEVWDNPADFPTTDVKYIDSMQYADGSTYKELETMALTHAKYLEADGINIMDVGNGSTDLKIDAGIKRAELVVNGFDLEEHGVGPDTLHFSKNIYTKKTVFKMYVKFFKYKRK